MPKVNVYLPDDMAAEVRGAQLSLSPICQEAIRKALDRLEAQRAATADIEAVVERLRQTLTDDEVQDHREGYADGVEWAREYATVAELRKIVDWRPGTGGDFEDDTIVEFFSAKEGENVVSVSAEDHPYWGGFIDGAREVLAQVEPLL